MMSPDINKILAKSLSDDNQSSGGRRRKSTTGYLKAPNEQVVLKCPRCDSPKTKFCYYNNYSLSQPRHFCKACRRYWTNGGALRNIPMGGACRKNKKIKSNSIFSCDLKDSPSSSSFDFYGISPSLDFQLGGLPFSRLNTTTASDVMYNQHFNTASSQMGYNDLGSLNLKEGYIGSVQEMGSMNFKSNLATSIESLSYINQDLHWRIQQQRLSELLSEEINHQEMISTTTTVTSFADALDQKQQLQNQEPIVFQNLEIAKPEAAGAAVGGSNITTEWFFENSNYNSSSNATTNVDVVSNGEDESSNWSATQAWSNRHGYGA